MQRPFEGLLGNNCELRTLEFLLPQRGVEYNVTELAEEVGVSWSTAAKVMKKFEQWGILKPTRTERNATFYIINDQSPILNSIVQFNNVLIETMLGPEELYEIRDYLSSQLHRQVPPEIPYYDLSPEPWMRRPARPLESWIRGGEPTGAVSASAPVTWAGVQMLESPESGKNKIEKSYMVPICRAEGTE